MDDEELDEYETRYMSRGRKITRRVLYYLLIAVVVLINGILLWRAFFSTNIPASLSALTVNETVADTYHDAQAEGETLTVFTQHHDQLTWDPNQAYGYFWAAQALMIPDAGEIQLLVRYNNSTLTHMAEDFSLPTIPTREEEIIDVSLVITRKTGEKDKDGKPITETLRICTDGAVASGKKNMYNYRRYIFDGISFDENIVDISVNYYYIGAVDYDTPAFASVCIYDDHTLNEPYALSKKEIRAIESYK